MVFYWKRAAALVCALAALAACTGPAGGSRGAAGPIEDQLLAEIALERGDYEAAVNSYLSVARQSDDIDYARRATLLAWDMGLDAHALAAAERWLEIQPRDTEAHAFMARLAARFGQTERAAESVEIALGPAEMRAEQGYVSLAGDLLPAARNGLKLFLRLEEQYPQSPGIKRSLAELSSQTGDIAAATEYARQTIALRPDWDTTRAWLARLLLAEGDSRSAFEQMAFTLEANPGVEYELEFVRLMASAGELESAADRLTRVSERYPEEAAVVLVGAELLVSSGRTDEAAVLYRQLIDNSQCFSECYWQLALLTYDAGQTDAALDLLSQVGAGTRLQSAVLATSTIMGAEGDYNGALAVLDEYADNYPKRRFATFESRAAVLTAAGRYDEAIATTARALDYRPWSEALWLSHGAALEQGGQLDKALEAFRRAWELAPDSATTQNAYGYTLLLASNRYAEAQELIESALQLDPDNPAIMDSMGWALFKQGRVDEARSWLERAYSEMPDPEIAAHLVELYWTSGDRDAARELLAEAQALFPENRALESAAGRYAK